MLHHAQPILPLVFMLKDDLHPLCRPANVNRDGAKTLVRVDRSSLMAEVIMWAVEWLTEPERVVIRRGYGISTDLRVPFDDDLLDGLVEDAPIPDCLRLPGVYAQRTA